MSGRNVKWLDRVSDRHPGLGRGLKYLLAEYWGPYWLATLLAPICMLGEVFTDLLQPWFMSQIVDVGLAAGDQSYIIWTAVKMVGTSMLGIVGASLCMYFSAKAGYGMAKELRGELYRKVQSFSFANLDVFKTGSLVTRITNDVTQIQNAFQSCTRMLIRSPFLCIGGVIMVLIISPKLSLVVLATLPLMGIMIYTLMKRAFPLFGLMQQKLDRVNVVMQENLAGVRVIKAFGRAEYEKERFRVANDEMTEVAMRANKIMAMSFPLINLIMNMALIAMYWFGGQMAFGGELQAGDIMAFSNYILQILMSLTMSSFMLLFVSRAKVSIDRVHEVLNTHSDIVSGEHGELEVTEGKVEFKNVSFRYPGQGGEPVLRNLSFTAQPGRTVAILGATGSGKTSLISLIPRLYDATEGQVLVDGHDVREYDLKKLRKGIGVALQESVLFSGSIEENLKWGDENAPDEVVKESTRIAQADPFIQTMADGYDTQLGQRGVNLSGGQKQRLSIARALVKRPKILILDDSTSAVDMATEAQIQKGLREVMHACTVFIIAQRISSVMDADEIIVMEDGKIADVGTHEQLKERCGVYREIVISQLGKEAV